LKRGDLLEGLKDLKAWKQSPKSDENEFGDFKR
jgi:hypothetical protein